MTIVCPSAVVGPLLEPVASPLSLSCKDSWIALSCLQRVSLSTRPSFHPISYSQVLQTAWPLASLSPLTTLTLAGMVLAASLHCSSVVLIHGRLHQARVR